MDSGELKRGIENILSRVFTADAVKRSVREYPDRLNFACPYCHDSSRNRYKKRGNVYMDDLSFHCYNCGVHEGLYRFFSSFGEPLPPGVVDTLSEMKEGRMARRNAERNGVVDNGTFRLLDGMAIGRDALKEALHLMEVSPDGTPGMYAYLKGRNIPEERFPNFLYKPMFNELYVLNLANNGTNVVGAQVRSFDPSKPKYRSQNIETLYRITVFGFPGEGLDPDTVDDLNKLSLIYNALNFNIGGREIYVFEGGIDSFFLPNSLGQCGVRKDVPWLDSLSNVVYFFDNDDAGRERSAHKLKDGHKVFLWGKFLSENGFGCRVKDLNDFVTWCTGNGVDWSSLEYSAYTGDNELDMIYL